MIGAFFHISVVWVSATTLSSTANCRANTHRHMRLAVGMFTPK